MKELAKKYRNKDIYNYNCAEAILHSANEFYNLDLQPNAFKMMSGFGGGIQEKHLCGIVSGSIAVLGILFKDKNTKDNLVLEQAVREFKTRFRSKYGMIECDYLLKNHADDIRGCDKLIVESAAILEDVIYKYR